MKRFENKNYYEVLGVDREATPEEIKVAYRDIARVYHPDSHFYDEIVPNRQLGSDDVRIFKLVTAAYNTLIDPQRRSEYDRMLDNLRAGWESSASDDPPAEDFEDFRDFTDSYRRKQATSATRRTGFGVRPQDSAEEQGGQRRGPSSVRELLQQKPSATFRIAFTFLVMVCLGFLAGTIIPFMLRAFR